MAYLDVSPLMASLRARPEEFDFKNEWLRHIPSSHSFKFLPSGKVDIRAECNCAYLAIKPEQERQLHEGFQSWHTHYWQPFLINKEFASHFKPRSKLRRILITMTTRLNAWLIGGNEHHASLAAE